MTEKDEKRTKYYVFTSKKQITEFYSDLIAKDKLEGIIAEINTKPFTDRKEGPATYKLQKLKRIEWELNRYIKEHGTQYEEWKKWAKKMMMKYLNGKK